MITAKRRARATMAFCTRAVGPHSPPRLSTTTISAPGSAAPELPHRVALASWRRRTERRVRSDCSTTLMITVWPLFADIDFPLGLPLVTDALHSVHDDLERGSSGVVWSPGRNTFAFRHITRCSTRRKTVSSRGTYEKNGFEIFGEFDNLPRGPKGYFLGELFEPDMKAASLTLSLRENETMANDYPMSDGICYRMTSHPKCSPSAGLRGRRRDRRLELAVRHAGQQRPSRLRSGIRLRSRPEACSRLQLAHDARHVPFDRLLGRSEFCCDLLLRPCPSRTNTCHSRSDRGLARASTTSGTSA